MSAGETLTHALNRKAGTLAAPLDTAGAANTWAGITRAGWLDLNGALNVKAGNSRVVWKDTAGVLNQLAGTTGLDVDGAGSHL